MAPPAFELYDRAMHRMLDAHPVLQHHPETVRAAGAFLYPFLRDVELHAALEVIGRFAEWLLEGD